MQVRRGDILWMNLEKPPGGAGREQAGIRPTVVISLGDLDRDNPMITVVPLTSVLESQKFPYTCTINPSQINGLSNPSVALVFQVRSLDKDRIMRVAGKLETHYLEKVETLLRNLLSL
jgi:mRNA interferase MazF